ncbi:hypothetical protein RN001_015878 [Aquatica leii]|uniref:Microtubule-associated protein Jupiter n=1 Tax=Aquatica leii TaxID=1421715 RepID=A0AAN7SB39_9COLE|nr:hypothetical protein RN001_015878 [Aquatica leii]
MTSTNINIGIDGRTSSRILKPPGGAHTDIFGTPVRNDSNTGRFAKQSQKSSISECFEYKSTVTKEVKENRDLINGNENEPINIISEEENPKPIEKPSRIRIPPGGFSSSLW